MVRATGRTLDQRQNAEEVVDPRDRVTCGDVDRIVDEAVMWVMTHHSRFSGSAMWDGEVRRAATQARAAVWQWACEGWGGHARTEGRHIARVAVLSTSDNVALNVADALLAIGHLPGHEHNYSSNRDLDPQTAVKPVAAPICALHSSVHDAHDKWSHDRWLQNRVYAAQIPPRHNGRRIWPPCRYGRVCGMRVVPAGVR